MASILLSSDGPPQLRPCVPDTQLQATPADTSGSVASDRTSPGVQILPVDATGAHQSSSMYTLQKLPNPDNIFCINLWKVAGVLEKPKGMASNLKRPS